MAEGAQLRSCGEEGAHVPPRNSVCLFAVGTTLDYTLLRPAGASDGVVAIRRKQDYLVGSAALLLAWGALALAYELCGQGEVLPDSPQVRRLLEIA